jgi:hypothetical protein
VNEIKNLRNQLTELQKSSENKDIYNRMKNQEEENLKA